MDGQTRQPAWHFDPRAELLAQRGTAVGRVMRALDLGIYSDLADARAHATLTELEWAYVAMWWAVVCDAVPTPTGWDHL